MIHSSVINGGSQKISDLDTIWKSCIFVLHKSRVKLCGPFHVQFNLFRMGLKLFASSHSQRSYQIGILQIWNFSEWHIYNTQVDYNYNGNVIPLCMNLFFPLKKFSFCVSICRAERAVSEGVQRKRGHYICIKRKTGQIIFKTCLIFLYIEVFLLNFTDSCIH